jgi:hypothetical protein
MVDNRHEYYFFPEADEPAMVPLAFAFVRMMFAHAAFGREVRDLQGAVTGDPEFG